MGILSWIIFGLIAGFIGSKLVNKEGQVGNVRIRRGVSPSLDAEAIRVVLGMPRWSPGRKDGTPVAVRFTIPLAFKLNKEQPQAPPAGTH